MKSRVSLTVVMTIALLTAVTVCMTSAQTTGKEFLRVRGSNFMSGLIDILGRKFMESTPGTVIGVSGGGADAGFQSLAEKKADLVMVCRRIYPKERQMIALSEMKPVELSLPKACLVFVTRPDNTVKALTLDQLRKIYAGDITRWNEVGGPDQPISVLASDPLSGAALYVKRVLLDRGFFTPNIKYRTYFTHMTKEISHKANVDIGFTDMTSAQRAVKAGWVKILDVKKDETSPAVTPSKKALDDGSYPLGVPMYLYWNEGSSTKTLQAFVQFCAKNRGELR